MKLTRIFKRAATPKVIGRHLHVSLPELGLTDIRAKVDTGAYSGALHAEKIHEVAKRGGKRHLRFKVAKGKTVELADFHTRKVVSSSGHVSERYAITTTIRINGDSYPIVLTLTDRSYMRKPLLIGRSFLRTHGYLVDVKKFNE